jgi:hypothetical protein
MLGKTLLGRLSHTEVIAMFDLETNKARVGYTVDRAALQREFPDVAFHDFESWAKTQDWNALL